MKKQAIFISTLVVLLFASCASEQQLARRFIREANTYNIAVEFPQQLFLTNSKVENLYPNFQEMDSEQQNELLVRHTQFLNNLNEADLRTSYCSTFVKTLQELKLNVIENAQYPDSTLDNTLLNVRMLQLEWEEDSALMRYSRSISYYEDVYKDLTVNELNLNVWLEYTAPNAKPKVLFCSESYRDDIDGKFTQKNDEYVFNYNKTPVDAAQIETKTVEFARTNATAFFNYLMNVYIQQNSAYAPQYLQKVSYNQQNNLLQNRSPRISELDIMH